MLAHTGDLPVHGWHGGRSRRASTLKVMLIAAMIASIDLAHMWDSVGRAPSAAGETPAAAGAYTSFGRRAAHNGRYHAEVVGVTPLRLQDNVRWTVRLERRNHRRVAHARIVAEAWMPETKVRATSQPRVSYVGGGMYEIDGLYFSQPGWWNVALVIDGKAGVDSVAFNVILPDRSAATQTSTRLTAGR